MEKAQELAKEHDKGTLQEAAKQKGPGAHLTATEEGEGNKQAEEIADQYDKEVIEKAVEIKEQEEAKQQQMAMKAQQAMMKNKVNISPDAMAGGGMGGGIPQGAALRGMI